MKYSMLLLFFCFSSAHLMAQTSATVNATGEVQIPADLVILQINITVTNTSASNVFEIHKERETHLSGLIRERGIETDQLRFQPMQITGVWNGNTREYRSNQYVRLTLEDFDMFEEIQIFLIENGFDNFSGQFGSTQQLQGEEDALELAITNARAKADIIAESLGKSVVRVTSVEHGSQPVTMDYRMETMTMMSADSSSLMEFEQQIRVRSTVSIDYLLD